MISIDPALSSGYYVDAPRQNVQPTRSQQMSIAYLPFDNLTGWTNISGSGATATISDPGDTDPAIGLVLDLKAGATLGASAGVQKVMPTVPACYGLFMMDELTCIGADPADALTINLQNSQNRVLMIRLWANHFEVFSSGGWRNLYPRGGPWWMEAWVEVAYLGGTSWDVALYLGTAKVGHYTGELPAGASGNTNLLWMQQFSGATANRRSKMAIIQIGATQLPDAMTLVSKPELALQPCGQADFIALVENTCQDMSGLSAALSNDGGATWEAFVLTDRGRFDAGVVDTFKDVRIMAGSCSFPAPGQAIRKRIQTTAGSFLPVLEWRATCS